MNYKLDFHPDALKEWRKLDETIKRQFKKKLAERLEQPRIPAASVSGGKDLYKIKLAATGYRLVYLVLDDTVVVYVLSVGKRKRNCGAKNHAKNPLQAS